jgi:antitoxin HigA-1
VIPNKHISTQPGQVLLHDFLIPLNMTQTAFARHIGVPTNRVNAIVRGKRGITAETAWLFAQALGTTPEFWVSLQANHDLAKNHPKREIPRLVGTPA